MQKIRVSEIADEAGISNKDVIEKAKDIGFEVKAANSGLDEGQATLLMEYILTGKLPASVKKKEVKAPVKKEVKSKEPKDNTKIEKISKNETSIVNKKDEEIVAKPVTTLASVGIKRTGIRVTRRAPRPVVTEEKEPTKIEKEKKYQEKSMKELFNNTDHKLNNTASSRVKIKKKSIATSSEHGILLNIDRSLSDVSLDDNLEVMLDLHEDVLEKKEEAPKKDFNKSKHTPNKMFQHKRTIHRGKAKKRRKKEVVDNSIVTEIDIPKEIRVYEFAEACKKTPSAVISVLFLLGKMVTKNDFLDEDEIEILADDFEIKVTYKEDDSSLDYIDEVQEENIGTDPKAPIVTIMGHVDHGKTSLLDYIKNTKVASGEAGGITQHMGAYQVEKNGQKITFIDTPGHEAFDTMRSRGASITDIIIIVVAADDGVKPQTIEAIKNAKNAKVPIIVAMNKIDKSTANIELVKTQMAEHEIMSSDWGGDYDFVGVSAHTGEGVDDLLETILIQSELLELKGNKDANAKAVIIESSLEKGKGPVATVIMQNGTLKVGDSVVADTTFGRVRAIVDDKGNNVKELGLSQPGQVLGLGSVPTAGVVLMSMDNEKEAREIASKRAEAARIKQLSKSTKVSIEELSALVAEGKIKALPIIIKTDVQGSLEAIKGSLEKLKNDEVKINIIHSGVGGITESDISLASASTNSLILGFNVRPTGSVKNRAKSDGVEIKTYSIIYDLLDDVRELLSGMMSPVVSEENTGQAEVREVFTIGGVGTIAGCFVNDGKVIKGGLARVIRDGVVIYDNSLVSSLKRFKDEVKEVGNGYECGIMLQDYNDVKVGDVIETFTTVETKATIS